MRDMVEKNKEWSAELTEQFGRQGTRDQRPGTPRSTAISESLVAAAENLAAEDVQNVVPRRPTTLAVARNAPMPTSSRTGWAGGDRLCPMGWTSLRNTMSTPPTPKAATSCPTPLSRPFSKP